MFTTRPELLGTFGMVTSTHWLASQAGMAILEEDGNAFDAAVAAAFVLHVVEPHLNGPGGDLPLIFRTKDSDRPQVLSGQGVAPQAATIEHFDGLGLDVIPGTGLLATAVPGASVAWLMLLRDHGTKTPAEVLRFAIGYAEHGHPVLGRVVDLVDSMSAFFTEHWPSSADTWLPAPAAGGLLRLPVLAETYRRLVVESETAGSREAKCDAAIAAWSQGFVADAIDRFARTPFRDSSGRDHAGVITGQDLADWSPGYEDPLSVPWRGRTVFKCPGWTQGPAFLQTLALIDPLLPASLDELGPEQIHTIVEAQKLAFADRDAWFGDATGAPDLAGLFDEAYLAERRLSIGTEASLELRAGALGGADPQLPARARRAGETPAPALAGTGEPTVRRDGLTKGDTCHIDVTDRWGNVVSATPSGGWLQSSPTVPELGFCLGSRMQMAWLEPGLPSSLEPGRRPRTTLSPGLAMGDDGVVTAFGTPGGDQQDQWPLVFWLAHTLLRHEGRTGLNLQESIDHPSFNITALISSFEPRVWTPGGLEIEARYDNAVIDDLRGRGHQVTVRDDWSLGRMSAASYDPKDGVMRAGANPRGMQGYAVGR